MNPEVASKAHGSNLDNLETNLHITCTNKGDAAGQHRAAREKLQTKIVAVLCGYDRTSNRASRQSTERCNGKRSANTSTDLANIRQLGDKSWNKTDVSARGETKDHGEDNDAGCVLHWNPNTQAEKGRDEGDGNHDVVSTKLVSDDAWDDTAQNAEIMLVY